MNVLIITFALDGIDDAAYQHQVAAIAPIFTDIPGLIGKVWLADADRNTYGGVYFFHDHGTLDDYLSSEIVRNLATNPNFRGLSLQTFGTLEEATAITGGPVAMALASG